MQAHGSHAADPSRKSRATSCTECRQVKLKCDLRESYPSPCSRCQRNKLDCRTDSSFKRVPARSRIKYLENEISHLKRARALDQATSANQPEASSSAAARAESTAGLSPQTLSDHEHRLAIRSSKSASIDSGSQSLRPLLIITQSESKTAFILGTFVLPYEHALTLIQTFEVAFYPHFACLEQIESLGALHDKSELLFWTIITLASAHHISLSSYFTQLRDLHAQLLDQVCRGPLGSLPDIQAILLMCDFPNFRKGIILRDSSWHLLGSAIFSARQIGLDRETQEGFLGIQQNLEALWQHSRYTRRMTWLKCFESDVLWSAWYGHLPTVALPSQLDRIVSFCQDPIVPREYAGIIEVLVEMTRHTVALSDGLVAAPSSIMVRAANRSLEDVRTRFRAYWSVKSELYFLSAKNNLYMTALVLLHVADPSREERNETDLLYSEIITAARSSAVQFAGLATDLGTELLTSPLSASLSPEAQPFGGWPKFFGQMLYYAGCVMIKYLDSPLDVKVDDVEETRNAYGRMYQLFANCAKTEENLGMAAAFDVAGRALVDNSCRLKTRVTTRLAASLYYNVSWMAVRLRDPTRQAEQHETSINDPKPTRVTPRPSPLARTASVSTLPSAHVQMQDHNVRQVPLPNAMSQIQGHPQSHIHQQPPPPSVLPPAPLQCHPQQVRTASMPNLVPNTSMSMTMPNPQQPLESYGRPPPWDPQAAGLQPNNPFPFGNWNNALYDSFLAAVQPGEQDGSYRFPVWGVQPPAPPPPPPPPPQP